MIKQLDPLEDLVGELFVDRHEEVKMYWEWGTNVPPPVGNSRALIGRRRTGKTSILVRVFNRLFHEQEKILPVYVSFAQYLHLNRPLTMQEVGDHYLAGYLSSFLAFRYRRPEIMRSSPGIERVRQLASEFNDPIVDELLRDHAIVSNTERIGDPPAQFAINTPRTVAGLHTIPTAVIVDEFQVLTTVYDPVQDLTHDLTDSFQWAADTRLAPLLVSGSSISLLVGQALGGMLSGRFKSWHLKPLTQGFAYELVRRLGERMGIVVTEELAEAIWRLTDGYPFSINSLMTSVSPARRRLPSLDALQEVANFELTDTNGDLYQHYSEEFNKYSHQLNEGDTTRKVMLWTTKYPDQTLDPKVAATELGLDERTVREALEKLRWADIVRKSGLITYVGPSDPMLRRFIEYQHYTEIEKLGPDKVFRDWEKEYKKKLGALSRALGEVGEMYAYAVIRNFDGQEVSGADYFNHDGSVWLPYFDIIERQGGHVFRGIPIEIDLIGEWFLPQPDNRKGVWFVQVRYQQRKMGKQAVEKFLEQIEHIKPKFEDSTITSWYFSKSGFTEEAAQILREAGVLFSDWDEFCALAKLVGFLGLPP
ncbi:hypothetical protein KFU94_16160 [Chloroflexi bacterium TSY]|nr:hypothetical protein [Chloroflexi bacterium TSY]